MYNQLLLPEDRFISDDCSKGRNRVSNKRSSPITRADYQPLYTQVKSLLVKRIGAGDWKPGEMLPSENVLASEFNVSQGTVRKALIALEVDRLIVRRQGVGTFVSKHSSDRTLFHFFRMVGLDDRRMVTTSTVITQRRLQATRAQASRLLIEPGAALHGITRVRHLDGFPAIFEKIFVPAVLMPGLIVEEGKVMGDEMYVIYQEHFGISIARATERLAAIAATREDARYLNVKPSSPLLEISRIASDVNGRPIELRISRCDTAGTRYAAEVQ